ncbi:hypothetical protein BHYA_1142g00010, partial [Botrytis hyacinthi]
MPSHRNPGRPRKYANAEEARKANNINNRLRARKKKLQSSDSNEFVVYQSSSFTNIFANNSSPYIRPSTGLLMATPLSQDQILEAHNVCESGGLESSQPALPVQGQSPSIHNYKEIDIQKNEMNNQEINLVEEECDTNIAKILMELQSAHTILMDSNSIKKIRGRPRKFTQEEATASKRNSNRYAQQRRRHPRIAAGPSDFIAYEPLPSDIPTNTLSSGLRVSPDIPIPIDDDTSIENPSNVQPNHLSSTSSQIELTTELEEQMRQIRLAEEEADTECSEYENAISEKMKETNIAIGSVETVIQSVNTINTIQEQRVGGLSEDRISDNVSTPASNSRHLSLSVPGSAASPILLSSPIQLRSPSFQSSNQSRSQQNSSVGRNQSYVQSNLEAWLTPSPHSTSRQNTTPSPSLPRRLTHTSSSTHSQIESVPPSTPSESVIPSTPAFINPGFAPPSSSTGNPSPA